MKKARQIIIPLDRSLTWEEYEDFNTHAKNSSIWYATAYSRTEKQIVDKLLAKGYLLEDVIYTDKAGGEARANMIQNALDVLKENSLLNDDSFALNLTERYSDSNKGEIYIKQKLRSKGIDDATITRVLEETRSDEKTIESIALLAERFMKSSSYRREENPLKKRQKLTSHLFARGFGFSDIKLWEDQDEE